MKAAQKIIALVCSCAILIFMFTACAEKQEKDENSTSSKYSLDIVALASSGKIPEIPFTLGSSVDEIVSFYKKQLENDDMAYELVESQDGDNTVLDYGSYAYYYDTEQKANGIKGITSVDTVFGFAVGSVIMLDDVKQALGENYTESVPTSKDLFFLPGEAPQGAKMLYVNAGDNVLKLFFFNNYLSAASLFNSDF